VPVPLADLNAVYGNPISGTKSNDSDVLPRDALDQAIRTLEMSLEESKDLLRAHEQVLLRVKKTKTS
jgi:hypothetical protein